MKTVMKFFIFIGCLVLCGYFISFISIETDTTFAEQNKASWQACIDSGGVPLRSAWSSQMTDCKYNNEK